MKFALATFGKETLDDLSALGLRHVGRETRF